MGMFDTIYCHAPLPFPEELADPAVRAALQAAPYQTKDIVSGLDTFELRADGSLWLRVRVPWGEEDTFGEPRWVPATTVLGHVRFYAGVGDESTGWVEFKATIVDGHLRGPITLVRYTPVDPAEEAKRAAHRAEWLRGLGQ